MADYVMVPREVWRRLTDGEVIDPAELADASAQQQQAEPVAWTIQSNVDGSFTSRMAPVRWHTFDKEMEKLRSEPWVKVGRASIVPLYASPVPRITAEQVAELKRLADEYAGDKALLHVIVASASDTFTKPDPHKSRAALHATLDALVKEE